jgi:hypothetical protein
MFNPLTPSEVISAIGVTVRDAVRGGELTSDFERDQLMSAYSATRHLAVEIADYPRELAAFAGALAARIEAGSGDLWLDRELADCAAELRASADAYVVGAATASLAGRLSEAEGEPAAELLSELRSRLRRLADREVELLAAGLS